MVSNHFSAKVVTQCSGALPIFPCLHVFHYLSLISWRFGGLSRIAGPAAMVVVVVAGRMLKDGDQCGKARRRLPVASAGDAWVEGGMSPGLGRCPQKGIKIPPRLEQSVSLLFLFSSSGVGSSLFPM